MRRWVLTVIGAIAFVLGALGHARWVNVDWHRHDQDAYLFYARMLTTSHYEWIGNRLQMPLYPAIVSLVYDENPDVFFARAKMLAIALTAAVAALSVALLRRVLPSREATIATILFVFFVLAFRAAYVQAETLSYLTIFACFLLYLRLWQRPSWGVAILTGAVTALGFYLKATALLGLYVFLACVAVRETILLFAEGKIVRRVVALARAATVFAVFFAIVWPYAKTSKAIFGSYFHNMSNAYVMWCDSWEEFLARENAQHLNLEGHRLPPDQVPSMTSYWHTHTIGQIVMREVKGLGEVAGNCLLSHGYALPFLLLAGFAVAMLTRREVRARVFRKSADAGAWFAIPYLAVHVILYGWYGPIAAGNRFILAMMLPATVSILRMMRDQPVSIGKWTWPRVLDLTLAVLMIEIVVYYPVAILTHYSGG